MCVCVCVCERPLPGSISGSFFIIQRLTDAVFISSPMSNSSTCRTDAAFTHHATVTASIDKFANMNREFVSRADAFFNPSHARTHTHTWDFPSRRRKASNNAMHGTKMVRLSPIDRDFTSVFWPLLKNNFAKRLHVDLCGRRRRRGCPRSLHSTTIAPSFTHNPPNQPTVSAFQDHRFPPTEKRVQTVSLLRGVFSPQNPPPSPLSRTCAHMKLRTHPV